jgi:hypothetical protein
MRKLKNPSLSKRRLRTKANLKATKRSLEHPNLKRKNPRKKVQNRSRKNKKRKSQAAKLTRSLKKRRLRSLRRPLLKKSSRPGKALITLTTSLTKPTKPPLTLTLPNSSRWLLLRTR